MANVRLWGWATVVVGVMVLTCGSPTPLKRDPGKQKGVTAPPLPQSSSLNDDDDDEDSYDYEYGYPKVQLLFAADSEPRKIQKPCKEGYRPRRGKCRKVANIHRR